ncbi:MAG: leucyl aminopeptidase family protein [Hyphomicrobiales bacterium]|nr:leucyl aminopeptidase family protein [Hyphomicrobiales bacterium]
MIPTGASDRLTSSPSPFADGAAPSVPIFLVASERELEAQSALDTGARAWLAASGFKPSVRRPFLVPGAAGSLGGVVLGTAPAPRATPDPMERAEILVGALPPQLPPARYRLASPVADTALAEIAWGLGAWRLLGYKSQATASANVPLLDLSSDQDRARVQAIVEGIGFGRDLIAAPANEMGPAELQAAAERLAARHGMSAAAVVGDDLLASNYPLIHAVGRASPRAPRLIDLRWDGAASADAPRVTLVGKGICFDTGGLDIKPPAAMLLMKKDMGGAAAVLALGHMIMAQRLNVKLRILLAAAENAVSGNAFRPGDVIASRAGLTVEIGNTDAEGRLVLADALALADEEAPDLVMSFATLTGAARVAVGAELAPVYCDDDGLADALSASGLACGDPLWRMPFWSGYDAHLDSPIADMNNVAEGPFGGSIIAALFLRRFVRRAKRYAHFDIYGWRSQPKPLGPKGPEAQGARAALGVIEDMAMKRGRWRG